MNLSNRSGKLLRLPDRWRHRFAASLGVRLERKTEIYLSLAQAATLTDVSYWLQILFAAGVATLGLVLNSPAVIIGAMLISPLMGPILSAGLALAAGDLILGLRAAATLALSCLVAISFAVLLVGLLPFKEMTGEIAARTQPNTLDLVVALFSGAIGSIATCKKAEGVVTSIPGVAIAVALMPPLCVVGYGIGLAFSLNATEGLQVARGGGLLFLTNLVAITFTAMLVFLLLRIDVGPVTERVREWRRSDAESERVRRLLERLRLSDKIGQIGGLYSRLLVILIPLLLILIPLSRSFIQLKRQYDNQRQENNVRRVATDFWQQQFAKLPGGEQRSVLDRITISEPDGKLTLALRVFTSKPYTVAERNEFARLVAARLGRSADSVDVQLLEIPTAAGLLASRAREEKPREPPLTAAQVSASFRQSLQSALAGLRLPPAAQLLDYQVVIGAAAPPEIVIHYLAEREVEGDAQALIAEDVRARFGDPSVTLRLERVPASWGPLLFRRNEAALNTASANVLLQVAQLLQQRPECRLTIITQSDANERAELAEARAETAIKELEGKYQIERARINVTRSEESGHALMFKLQTAATFK